MDDMQCVLDGCSSKYVDLLLTDELAPWWQSVEAMCVEQVAEKSDVWFGKRISLDTARDMLASVMDNKDCIRIHRSGNVLAYRQDDAHDLQRVDFDSLADKRYRIVPIVRFDGLYIREHTFSCVFTLLSLIVGEPEEDLNSSGVEAFHFPERSQDLQDPLEGCTDDDEGFPDSMEI